MLSDLNRVIEQLSKEKGIDRSVIVEAVEQAMLSAAKRTFGLEKNIEAKFNSDIGEVELFEIKSVVEIVADPLNEVTVADAQRSLDPDAQAGDELLAKLPSERFGRIAAQAAKQAIIQRVRDAERDIIYNEFKGRKGELVSGTVQRFEKKSLIVNLGRTDAILPEKEQIPRERYRQGDRIRAYICDVELAIKGPQIVLSRTHPGLLIKLFEQEVPEIYEGIVEVKGAAREPGSRAKIAVISNDRDVDPVGACVGMRGTRVQAVVQELRGEKIDIVPWTQDPAEYVCEALKPAKVSKIFMDEDDHAMEVIVPDDQLSLAIGKKGQNVRLASRLTTWKLDVRSESDSEREAADARSSLRGIPGVNEVTAELLYQAGYKSAEDLATSDEEALAEIEGIGPERAVPLLVATREHVVVLRAEAAAAAEVAAAEAAAAAAAAEVAAAEAEVAAAEAAAEAAAAPAPDPSPSAAEGPTE
jgi:transcription termination/antitermination protein NusA